MLQIHVNVCQTVQLLQDFVSAMVESWKQLKTSNVFHGLLCIRIEIDLTALVCAALVSELSVSCMKINHLCYTLVI